MSYQREFLLTFGDCDPANILYFANYPHFAHETIENFMKASGGWELWFAHKDHGVPLAHCETHYYKPIFLGQTICNQLSLDKIGNSSVSFKIDFLVEDQLCSQVKTIHVFVNRQSKKKQDIPEDVLVFLKKNFKL